MSGTNLKPTTINSVPVRRPMAWIALALLIAAGPSCSGQDTSDADNNDIETHTEGSSTVSQSATAASTGHTYTNRLIDETSPYLLQHAHNPVDWYPWGEEALAKAKAEDKPIFLSIGYSSCHWCHVMERESFESEAIAEVLNQSFVSIKVDREERPDLDEIYMTAVQAMTGSGGWPMTVFLTPELKPFFGGTYFPPEDRYGRPGFKSVLRHINTLWNERRDEVYKAADSLTNHLDSILTSDIGGEQPVTETIVTNAARQLATSFDPSDGGFGPAPKFPSAPSIQILLREYARTGNERYLEMVTLTLDKMAHGGIYDHLGGGFARYSTDDQWLVPHFEKMLYDNAQLATAYLEAYQVTGDPLYRQIVEETFQYVLRDMRDARGGFHSAEDADSEGEEGKFYIWTHEEIMEVLGEEDGRVFAAYYNVNPSGNFASHESYHQGQNILHTPRPAGAVAKELGLTADALREKIAALDDKMLAVRSKRVRPGLDDKVLTSWNALMISAMAQGALILNRDDYAGAAREAARFILTDMRRDGKLLRTHRKGESRLPAYLDDYAYMVVALLDLYEADFDIAWIEAADEIAKTMIAEFWDDDQGTFYFTSEDHENLLVRARMSQDGAVPSGNSMAALGLLRLAKFVDNPDYYDKGERILRENYRYLNEAPRALLKMVVAADFLLYPPKELAIAGPIDSAETQALLEVVRTDFIPNKILAQFDPASDQAARIEEIVPLLAAKTLQNGKPAAYVCKNFSCKLPVTDPDAFREQLVGV